ncbi:MAG: hypothetical protein ACI3W5_06145 [Faecousia sp.]
MNKTKRSSMMVRLVAALVVVMMFTMCFVGGTFAKYISSATGTDSARVAKWSIKVGDTDIATLDTFTFDLFKTILDSDRTNAETDIAPADGTIIAPGTSGSFEIVIKNESEVTAQYTIDYTVTNTNNIPVEFSVDGGTTWTADLADVAASDSTKLAVGASAVTVTVQWRWRFEDTTDVAAGDAIDTPLGVAATAVLEVKAEVTATQVD